MSIAEYYHDKMLDEMQELRERNASLARQLEDARKIIEDACLSVGETRAEFERLRGAALLLDVGGEWTPIDTQVTSGFGGEGVGETRHVRITYAMRDRMAAREARIRP